MRMIVDNYTAYNKVVSAVQALAGAGALHDISQVSGNNARTVGTTTISDTMENLVTGAITGASMSNVLGGGAGLLNQVTA